MNKEICKKCRKEGARFKDWDLSDEYRWDIKKLFCWRWYCNNRMKHPYISIEQIPEDCYYYLEQVMNRC